VKHNPRREVWRAVIGGTPYYLKYYFAARWRDVLGGLFQSPQSAVEWAGGMYAFRAGIPAVRPVAFSRELIRDGRRCALLVTAAIEPAMPLDAFWRHLQTDTSTARRRADAAQLFDLLGEMIARSHQAGFEHRDMHAANILVEPVGPRQYRTAFVDLHSARRGVPISDRAVVRNLAQLNQWFRKNSSSADRLRFLRAYFRWRNELELAFDFGRPLGLTFAELVRRLAVAAERHAERLGVRRDHRIRRDGRYFVRLKLGGGWRGMAVKRCKHPIEASRASQMVFDRAWWTAQLRDPLRWFKEAGEPGEVCKASHSGMVRRVLLQHPSDRLPVIIKRPLARNWRRAIVQCLAVSRSLRGWRRGHAMLHRDIPTAHPLAVLERRVGPFVVDSLLVTEAVPEAVDLETFLRREYEERAPADWARLKRALIDRLVTHLRRFLERGFYHRDCKASNVLVVPLPEMKLLWIDMDGVRPPGRHRRERELWPLVRLHVSLLAVPGLTRTDRVRFLRAFFTRFGSSPDHWREAWGMLAQQSEEKVVALASRRAWKRKHYGRE
jgi:hypothetical protein